MYGSGHTASGLSECCSAYVIENCDGFDVCSICGLVLNQAEGKSNGILQSYPIRRDILATICDRGHIPTVIEDEARELVERTSQLLRQRRKRISHLNVISYALYKSLIRHGVPRDAGEVEWLCEASKGCINLIARLLAESIIMGSLSHFLQTFLDQLRLPYNYNSKILRIIRHIKLEGRKPLTVCAVATYIYESSRIMKGRPPNVWFSDMCTVASLSQSSILSVIKMLEKRGIIVPLKRID